MQAKTLWYILVLMVVLVGCLQENQGPVACTLDAKICPDGTAVGRIAPNCEFAPCPGDSASATDTPPPKHFPDSPIPTPLSHCIDGETRDGTCPDGVSTYLAENCVDGRWATVMYIRNPCEPLPGLEPACDALNPCAVGDCYKFQDEVAPICWVDDPCKKCKSGECNIAESYPMQVFCK